MKRTIIHSLIITSIFLMVVSCSDDFLSPKPKSFFAPENVYTNAAGLEAQLVTQRKNLVWENCGRSRNNAMANQWSASEASIHNFPGSNRNWTDRVIPSAEVAFTNQLKNMYEFVKDANVVISRIDEIEWENQEARNKILAEALWHRAYWYYRMIHSHGDIPFVREEISGARVDFYTHSRWSILNKIQEDLEFAVQHLPVMADPTAITRGAGNHLLTKVALANLDYATARDAATQVINGPYDLMRDRFGVDADDPKRNVLWDLHRPMNKNNSENSETILAPVDRYDVPEDAKCSQGTGTMRIYHPPWWSSSVGKDSEGNRGMIDSGPMYDSLGRGNPIAYLNDWYAQRLWNGGGFTWEGTPDLRRADINWADRDEYFYNNPESIDYGEPFDPDNMEREPAWAWLYAVPFHKTYVPDHPDEPTNNFGSNGDWYIFRLAETYLLRAEAYFWLGQRGQAADDINVVRERAQAPTLVAPGEVTIDYIMDERARELALETPRQNELNRVSYILAARNEAGYSLNTIHENNFWYDRVSNLNDFFNPPTIGFNIEPYHFQWPIPDDIISENTLGRINQAPGYPGAEDNIEPRDLNDDLE